jgi:hypothetical protein
VKPEKTPAASAKNFTGPLPKPVTTFRRPSGHCAIITEADLVFFDRK